MNTIHESLEGLRMGMTGGLRPAEICLRKTDEALEVIEGEIEKGMIAIQ